MVINIQRTLRSFPWMKPVALWLIQFRNFCPHWLFVQGATNMPEEGNRSRTCISCRHMLWFQPLRNTMGGRLPPLSNAPTGRRTFTEQEKIHSRAIYLEVTEWGQREESHVFKAPFFITNHKHQFKIVCIHKMLSCIRQKQIHCPPDTRQPRTVSFLQTQTHTHTHQQTVKAVTF